MKSKTFSVVIPVFNSEKSLIELYTRLKLVFDKLGKSFEVIFVNDSSYDESINVLKEIKNKFQDVIIIDLFNNAGQQNAIMCGFHFCSGKYVITLDDDLQNPPEEIPRLYNKILDGYDAVFGYYNEKKDKKYKNIASFIIRKLNHKIFNLNNGLKFSSYRIVKREIIEEIKDIRTPFPYISGMILNVSRNIGNELIIHENRPYGKSNYNPKKLLLLSYNLLINYSSIPLKIIGYTGLLGSIITFIVSLFLVIQKIFIGTAPLGWTSLMVLISFSSSIIILILLIIGIYISRILTEVARTKQFSIKEIIK